METKAVAEGREVELRLEMFTGGGAEQVGRIDEDRIGVVKDLTI